jgi:hypothetical protein
MIRAFYSFSGIIIFSKHFEIQSSFSYFVKQTKLYYLLGGKVNLRKSLCLMAIVNSPGVADDYQHAVSFVMLKKKRRKM